MRLTATCGSLKPVKGWEVLACGDSEARDKTGTNPRSPLPQTCALAPQIVGLVGSFLFKGFKECSVFSCNMVVCDVSSSTHFWSLLRLNTFLETALVCELKLHFKPERLMRSCGTVALCSSVTRLGCRVASSHVWEFD